MPKFIPTTTYTIKYNTDDTITRRVVQDNSKNMDGRFPRMNDTDLFARRIAGERHTVVSMVSDEGSAQGGEGKHFTGSGRTFGIKTVPMDSRPRVCRE